MQQRRIAPYLRRSVLAGALLTMAACARPVTDEETIIALNAEAQTLMNNATPGGHGEIRNNQLPKTIASLKPEVVWASPTSTNILIKPFFDGGWGYTITRDGERLPEECFSDLGHNVYWHGTC